jgi:hypothetical protein
VVEISAASCKVAPAQSASVNSAIAVSPAPETSNTSFARVGYGRELIAIEKQHAMLAQCDQHRSESEFLQKSSSSLQQGFVRKRVISGAGISHASHAERFGSVGLDRRRTPPPQRISRIGIGSENSARLGDHCADAIDKALCKKSLPVVLEDDSVHARQNFSQLLEG